MVPKRDLRAKDAPGKKKARKSIMLEQEMDILRKYNIGESTAAISKALNLPESMLKTIKKDMEKIMAAVKAGAVVVLQRCRHVNPTSWSGWRCWSRGWTIRNVWALT